MSVYFLQAGERGPIKIGYTKQPPPDLHDMQRGSAERLTILAVIEGEMVVEKCLHLAFADLRLRGEWFRADARLMAMIRSLPPYNAVRGKLNSRGAIIRQRAVAKRALHEAMYKAGSRYALAKAIGITAQATYQWGDHAPAERVLAIEAATKVSRHDLRPDIYPREEETVVGAV